eukprot:CAMPEP_0178996222 /NCGR_PEP_ID=MMETSP0795-20121207/8259_1 /TAXON_ID=88552 /ORGANISM="Amoebophrya sp., Strain Ameob2" /LENGTH=139 /DNA_ID=CAMNT_0020688609 /DNA_START=210 /DNA_END=630 /DNA_ORIENTATION=+
MPLLTLQDTQPAAKSPQLHLDPDRLRASRPPALRSTEGARSSSSEKCWSSTSTSCRRRPLPVPPPPQADTAPDRADEEVLEDDDDEVLLQKTVFPGKVFDRYSTCVSDDLHSSTIMSTLLVLYLLQLFVRHKASGGSAC